MILNATINEMRTTKMAVRLPRSGVWMVDADLDTLVDPAKLAGVAVVSLGDLTLRGSFLPYRTGSFQLQSVCRVIGGAGGLETTLGAKHYHSDSGVRTRTVVADIIREAGETAGASTLTTESLGRDFVRISSPAGTLLRAILGTAWYANADGAICVGVRPALEIAVPYEVLGYDARHRVATVTTDNPEAITVGCVLRSRLYNPLQVHEIDMTLAKGALRLSCWGVAI